MPVDESGSRVFDPAICRLTLVVDESFADFRAGLNAEYVSSRGDEGNADDGPEPVDADAEVIVHRRKEKFESPAFSELWKRIRFRARYRVSLDQSVLPDAVASSEVLNEIRYLVRRANVIQAGDLEYDDQGLVITGDNLVTELAGEALVIAGQRLPNLVRLVEDHLLSTKFPLQLTRSTVAAIIRAIPPEIQSKSIDDPDRWARIVAQAVRVTTIEELVSHIDYEPLPESEWWDAEIVFVEAEAFHPPAQIEHVDPSYGVVSSPEGGSNLFDAIVYDSHVERSFGALLESDREHVKLFTKLPRRFNIRTPVGEYSPDWAVVYEQDGTLRLYLVRETKDTLNLSDLEWDEAMKIRFAMRHFDAAPEGAVDFTHTTDRDGLRVAIGLRP